MTAIPPFDDLEPECTHDHIEFGRCAGCGQSIDLHIPPAVGCQGRGWYHDGSEEEDAALTGRPTRPCPACFEVTA